MEKIILMIALVVGVVCAGNSYEDIIKECTTQCKPILESGKKCTSDVTDDNRNKYSSICINECRSQRLGEDENRPTDDKLLEGVCKRIEAGENGNEGRSFGVGVGDTEYPRKSLNSRRFDALEMLHRRAGNTYEDNKGVSWSKARGLCKNQCDIILDSGEGCTSGVTEENKKVFRSACNRNCIAPTKKGNPKTDEVLRAAICENKKVKELQAKTSTSENGGKIGLASLGFKDQEYARKTFNPRRYDALEMLRRRDALKMLRRRDWENRQYQREMAFRRRQDALESLRRNRDSDMRVQEKMAMRRRNDAYNKHAKVPAWMRDY